MPVLLTDYGARLYLKLLSGQTAFDYYGPLTMWFLYADPIMDRKRILYEQWPAAESQTDPRNMPLETALASDPVIIGPRAVMQWGPPAYQFNVSEDFTCYGTIYVGGENFVIWADRWETPLEFVAGSLMGVIPSASMTSECPPAGGCS